MSTFSRRLALTLAGTAAAAVVVAHLPAQQPKTFFQQVDANQDGSITREEFRSALQGWLAGRERATQEQLAASLDSAFPESTFLSMSSPPPNQTPKPEDVQKMLAALPASAPAKPAKPRKVLVLCKCAGFVHACIPLAAKTIESLGSKTGAWSTTVSYDASVINADNLKQYDLVFLNNTTGAFLDDPDPSVTAARRTALLDFVHSGKGLAGIHAASDSYHQTTDSRGFGKMMAAGFVAAADKNADQAVDAPEMNALADSWFDRIDITHAGSVSAADFRAGFPRILMSSLRRGGGPGQGRTTPAAVREVPSGPDHHIGTWPAFNNMIGGYFKYHWLDPQHIVYKIDDPASPLTAMFKNGFEVDDETYTFGIKSWSRSNLHVLTSIDYSKMNEADKRKEEYPRADHDYGLSWIRREGQGRVFYAAHGHSERVYAMTPMLEHLLAGIQYALGDLKANDAPGK